MFSTSFSLFSTLLLGLSYLANAAPVQPVEFLAVAPTITSPTGDSIWPAGSSQDVSWLTDNIPAEAQSYTVTILLGYFANNSENLDIRKSITSK